MRGHIFVGTWTTRGGRGIFCADWDETTGNLHRLRPVADTPNPTFLASHPSRPVLYAVNECADHQGVPGGGLSTFDIGVTDGRIALLATTAAAGQSPTHLEISPAGDLLALAHYNGPGTALFTLGSDGRPHSPPFVHAHTGSGAHPTRQASPHPHAAHFSPSGRTLLAPDLGTDRIAIYDIVGCSPGNAKLSRVGTYLATPGSGPRHLAFDVQGASVYALHELDNTLVVLAWNEPGRVLQAIQHLSTLPVGFSAPSMAAEVAVHPSGRFVYVSNRGADTLAVFRVETGGRLGAAIHFPTRGRATRHFAISPSGRWLIAANQDDDTLAVFALDEETGALMPHALHTVSAPACVLFFVR